VNIKYLDAHGDIFSDILDILKCVFYVVGASPHMSQSGFSGLKPCSVREVPNR
jgi:hypothetical protein